MTKSFTFNDPNYTARICVVTNKSVELIPSSSLDKWQKYFYNYMMAERGTSYEKSFEECYDVIFVAFSYGASSVRVSCCADETGISIVFDFKFDNETTLKAYMQDL